MVSTDKFNLLHSYIFKKKNVTMINHFSYKDKKILYICQNGISGYANAAKGYIYDFIKNNIPVKTSYFNCDDEINENDDFHKFLNKKTWTNINYDTIIVHSTPDIWSTLIRNISDPSLEEKTIIGRTVWEFEKLLPEWVDAINNSKVNIVSVPTEWNKKCFINSGVNKPIIVEPHIYIDYPYKNVQLSELLNKSLVMCKNNPTSFLSKLKNEDYYKFYCIGQFINRKGIQETVETFCKTFTSSDKVILLLKTFKFNYSEPEKIKCISDIRNITRLYNHAPIIFIKESLNYDEIKSLHDIGDCYFHLTKTEGFCLGAFESFNNNKKVVITGYGGQIEYLGNDYDGLVDYSLEPLSQDESVFFQFKLNQNYSWAHVDKQIASEKIKSLYLDFIKPKETFKLKKEKVIKLSKGWYDIESTIQGNFRWMGEESEIDINDNVKFNYLTIKSINLFNKKEISVFLLKKDSDEFKLLSSRHYEEGESILLKIPIKDVKTIKFKSNFFEPSLYENSDDERRLTITVYEFIFEENNVLYIQSINDVECISDVNYSSVEDLNIKSSKTNTFKTTFSYKNKSILYICDDKIDEYTSGAEGFIYTYKSEKIPVKKYINGDLSNINYNTVVIHTDPNNWINLTNNFENVNFKKKTVIGRTVWHFDKLMPELVSKINRSIVDIISVPNEWNKKCFIDSGITKHIMIEPYVHLNSDYTKTEDSNLLNKSIIFNKLNTSINLEEFFKFYCVDDLDKRKGVLDTIECFCKTFDSHDKVVFLLKINGVEQQKSLESIKKITDRYNHAPIIYLKNNINNDDDIKTLHCIGDCYIQLIKSEGFGKSIFDAYNKGKKIIVTGYGGYLEYLTYHYDGLVDYELTPSDISPFYKWAKPDDEFASSLMKKYIKK